MTSLCPYCLNLGPRKGKCKHCHRRRKVDQKAVQLQELREDAAVERQKFLSKMHQKLEDFNMETTGSKEVDDAIRKEIGDF